MAYTLQGTMHEVLDTVNINPTFRKREFVVSHTERAGTRDIVNLIKFEATQDRCEMLDGYAEGDGVEVSFNLRGREWVSPKGEKKYFTTLDAWKLQRVGQGTPPPPPPSNHFDGPPAFEQDMDNDLPF